MESSSQILDQLTEIHTFVGNIIEDGFVAVALILHITNLHVQSQTFGYLAALNHRGMLTGLCLLELLDVGLAGNAVDTFDIVG